MTSSLRPTSTDADILPTPRTCLHAGWDDGSTPVPGYRWYPVHDTPLASARGRCLVVVDPRLFLATAGTLCTIPHWRVPEGDA